MESAATEQGAERAFSRLSKGGCECQIHRDVY